MTMTMPKSSAATTRARRYAATGIGVVRFSSRAPLSRSAANPTPNPKREGPMSPKTP